MSNAHQRGPSLSRRPTTPLRRLSASSLRSLSLSHSRNRQASSAEPPLDHLGSIFAELADSLSDLAGNFEALDLANNTLDGFNEAFGAYLYSLRVNAYTVDFDEGPTPTNLERQQEHKVAEAEREREDQERAFAQQQQQQRDAARSDDGEQDGNETTFVTHDSEYSFMHKEEAPRDSAAARGRGRGRGRGGKQPAMSRRQREEMTAFTDSIIKFLPITFREQQPQRGVTEKIVEVLRGSPAAVSMEDFKTLTSYPAHRINESLTALVRAKIVLKVLAKGVTIYRLDPTRFPLS